MGKYDELIGGGKIILDVEEVLNEEAAKKVDSEIKQQKKKWEEPVRVNLETGDAVKRLNDLTAAAEKVQKELRAALDSNKSFEEVNKLITSYETLKRNIKSTSKEVRDNTALVSQSNKVLKDTQRIIDSLTVSQESLNKAQSKTKSKSKTKVPSKNDIELISSAFASKQTLDPLEFLSLEVSPSTLKRLRPKVKSIMENAVSKIGLEDFDKVVSNYLSGEILKTPETLLFTLFQDYFDKSFNGVSDQLKIDDLIEKLGLGSDMRSELVRKLNGLSVNYSGLINFSDTFGLGNIDLRIPEELTGAIETQTAAVQKLTQANEEYTASEEKVNAEREKAVKAIADRISKNSSIKGITKDLSALREESVKVAKSLQEMYNAGIRNSEAYITQQYKLKKIFDAMSPMYGGIKAWGDIEDLRRAMFDDIEHQTGYDILNRGVEDVLYHNRDSIFDKDLSKLRMKNFADLLYGWGPEYFGDSAITKEVEQTTAAIESQAKAVEAIVTAEQRLKAIENEEELEIIRRENGALEEKLSLLQEIAEAYAVDIKKGDRTSFNKLVEKEMSVGLTSSQEARQSELFDIISEAEDNLMEFEKTYDRIVLKFARGKDVEILPDDDGLIKLNKIANEYYTTDGDYNGREIVDVIFQRASAIGSETSAIETQTQAIESQAKANEVLAKSEEKVKLSRVKSTQNIVGKNGKPIKYVPGMYTAMDGRYRIEQSDDGWNLYDNYDVSNGTNLVTTYETLDQLKKSLISDTEAEIASNVRLSSEYEGLADIVERYVSSSRKLWEAYDKGKDFKIFADQRTEAINGLKSFFPNNSISPDNYIDVGTYFESQEMSRQFASLGAERSLQMIERAVREVQDAANIKETTAAIEEQTKAIEEATAAKVKYYEIDEKAARISKQMRSFDDYIEGSATASYRASVDALAEIAEQKKSQYPDKAVQIDKWLDQYSKNLAAYINRDNQIGAQYPSVMISGAGNYNVKKHNKQMASWGKNYQFYDDKVLSLQKKIESIGQYGTEVIRSDDEGALEKLESKLEYMKYWHQVMVEVNKYYRKNKTLEGFEGAEPDELERIKEDLATIKQVGMYDVPYPQYALTNDSQNIKRIEGRIAELKRLQSSGGRSDSLEEANDIYKLWVDKQDMRIRISFEMGKPDQEIIDMLKGKAFKWSPKNDAWQRQLTDNAISATKQLQKSLHEFYGIDSKGAEQSIESITQQTFEALKQIRELESKIRDIDYSNVGAKEKLDKRREISSAISDIQHKQFPYIYQAFRDENFNVHDLIVEWSDTDAELQKMAESIAVYTTRSKENLGELKLIKVDTSDVVELNGELRDICDNSGRAIEAYRGLANEAKAGSLLTLDHHSGATWFSTKKGVANGYTRDTDNLYRANLQARRIFEVDANKHLWGDITYLGDGTDDVSKRITELYERKESLKQETRRLAEENQFETETYKKLSAELRRVTADYEYYSNRLDNPYGTHDTNWYANYAQNNGYDAVRISNVYDTLQGGGISDVIGVFAEEQISNVEKITFASIQDVGNLLAEFQAGYSESFNNTIAEVVSSFGALNVSNAGELYDILIAKEKEYLDAIKTRQLALNEFIQANGEIAFKHQESEQFMQKYEQLVTDIFEGNIGLEDANKQLKEFADTLTVAAETKKLLFESPKNNFEKLANTLAIGDNSFEAKTNSEISGYSRYEREEIAEAIRQGLQSGAKEINIVLRNGKTRLTIAGDAMSAANILDKLGFKAVESEITKFIGKAFKKGQDVKYSNSESGNWVTGGPVAYRLSRPLTEDEYRSFGSYETVDFTKIIEAAKHATMPLSGEVREAIVDFNGAKKGGEKCYVFKTEDGQFVVLKKSEFDNVKKVSSSVALNPNGFREDGLYKSLLYGFGEDGSAVAALNPIWDRKVKITEDYFKQLSPAKNGLLEPNKTPLNIAGIEAVAKVAESAANAEAKVVEAATEVVEKKHKQVAATKEVVAAIEEQAIAEEKHINAKNIGVQPIDTPVVPVVEDSAVKVKIAENTSGNPVEVPVIPVVEPGVVKEEIEKSIGDTPVEVPVVTKPTKKLQITGADEGEEGVVDPILAIANESTAMIEKLSSAAGKNAATKFLQGLTDESDLQERIAGYFNEVFSGEDWKFKSGKGALSIKGNTLVANLVNNAQDSLQAVFKKAENGDLVHQPELLRLDIANITDSFDLDGMRARALAAIEKVRSGLHGLEYDLSELTTLANNIFTPEDWTKFSNQLKATQDNIQALKNATVSKSTMNQLANMQRDMANAPVELETMRLKLQKFGNIDGVKQAAEAIDMMTLAVEEFNAAQTAEGQQKAYSIFSEQRNAYNAQIRYLSEANQSYKQQESAINSATKAQERLNAAQTKAWKNEFQNNYRYNNGKTEIDQIQLDQMGEYYRSEEEKARQYDQNIKSIYQNLLTTIQEMNKLDTKMNQVTMQDGGSGLYTGVLGNMQKQKSYLVSELHSIGTEIQNALSITPADGQGVLSAFLDDVRVKAVLGEEAILKIGDALRQTENIRFEFGAKINEQIQPVVEKLQSLKTLVKDGVVTPGSDVATNILSMDGQLAEKYQNFKTYGTAQDATELLRYVDSIETYVNTLDKAIRKEREYFSGKTKYSTSVTKDTLTVDAEKQNQSLFDRKNNLEKAAKEFAQGNALITNFTQGADGIAKLDFSVFDTATNSMRTFRMEMGSLTDTMTVTETTANKAVDSINKSLASAKAASKQLGSAQSLIGRLGAENIDVNESTASAPIKRLLDEKAQLENAMKPGSNASTAEIDNYTKKLQMAIAEIEKLYRQYINMQNAIFDGKATGMGVVDDKNGNIYAQLSEKVKAFAATHNDAKLAIGGFNEKTNTLKFTLTDANGQVQNFTASMEGLNGSVAINSTGVNRLATSYSKFKGDLARIGRQLLTATVGYNVFYKAISQLRTGIGYVKEIDLAMTELRKVTDATEESYSKFLSTAAGSASEIGSTVSDFTNATANFARLGYSIDESADMAKTAIVYKNVADGLDTVDEATDSIISTMMAYGIAADDTMSIIDRFNAVGNSFAITSAGIGDAMQRSASALKEGGNTIDESIGLITAANSVIQNPEQVGEILPSNIVICC